MEKFCEFITNPAWWSVIATSATAIAAAIITWIFGRRQEKLQQQQLKLQKVQTDLMEQQNLIQGYEMRKMMFHFVHETNAFTTIFLPRICDYLREYRPYNNRQPLVDLRDEINKLADDFDDKFVDINIQLSALEIYDLKDLIDNMEGVIEQLEEIIDNKGIKDGYTIEDRILGEADSVYIDGILGFMTDDYAKEYRPVLEEYAETTEYLTTLFNSYIAGKIKTLSFKQ